MHRMAGRILLVSFCLAFASVASGGDRPVHVPSEILAKFRGGVHPEDARFLKVSLGLETIGIFRRIGVEHLRIAGDTELEETLALLRNSPAIEYAEPNYFRYIDAIPDDALFPQLWGLHNTGQTGGVADADIDAIEAWNITTGDPEFVVAVIDSGVDMSHPDLAQNIWTNPGEIPANGIDDDGNGYIDDVHGWDFSGKENDPSDTVPICGGHGTHVSGTIGAAGNNGIGVAGINWNVKIMPLKAFRSFLGIYCTAADSDLIGAIEYAADKGVKVSNNSYGGGLPSQAFSDAIRASRMLFVAAAGNEGRNNDVTPSYPASYNLPNIVSVAATDDADALAGFSNFGTSSVDIGAPGVAILSTTPNNTYSTYDGTSMATPHVAGSAAFLWADEPSLTVNEVKWRLLKGSDPKGLPVSSGGRLNVNNSLTLPPPTVTVETNPIGSTSVPRGSPLRFSLWFTNTSALTQTPRVSAVLQLPDGSEVVLIPPRTITLAPGASISRSLSKQIPINAPTGPFTVYGRAEVGSVSYDEDPAEFTVF